MHKKSIFVLLTLVSLSLISILPVREIFAGTGKTVQQGGSATLHWNVAGAPNCTGSTNYPINADGIQASWQGSSRASTGSVTFSSVQAAPGDYIFTCSHSDINGNIDAADSAVLTVTAPLGVTVTLNPFSPSGINVGQSSTISFSSTNATSCSGSGVFQGDLGGTSNPGASTGPMNTAGTYTQSVTCTGSSGSATSVTRTLTVCASGTTWNGTSCASTAATGYLNIFFN